MLIDQNNRSINSGPQLGGKGGGTPSNKILHPPKPASTSPQTGLSLAAVLKRWLLFSGDQQRTCRKVEQFGAMTFVWGRSAENLKLSRPIWRDDIFFFVSVFEDQHQLAQFRGRT